VAWQPRKRLLIKYQRRGGSHLACAAVGVRGIEIVAKANGAETSRRKPSKAWRRLSIGAENGNLISENEAPKWRRKYRRLAAA